MTVCSVLGCDSQSRTHPNYAFHRLPSAPAACQKWLRLMGRPQATLGLSPRVCSKHFEPNLYTERGNARVLVLGAVPSLFLPKVENQEDYPDVPLQALPPASKDNRLLLKKISWLRGKLVEARHNLRMMKAKQRRDRKHKPPKADKVKVEPVDIATCRACLALDTRLFGVRDYGLEDAFLDLTGTPISMDGLPSQLCAVCCALLCKCAAFRERCQRSRELLETLREWGPITISDVAAIDRQSHKLTLNLTVTEADKFDMTEKDGTHEAWIKTETHDQDAFVDTYAHDDFNEVDVKDSDEEIEAKEELNDVKSEVTVKVETEKCGKKRKVKSTKGSTKTTKRKKTGNTKENTVCKRKVIGDDIYPDFDYEGFEKEFKFKINVLSLKEQKQEIEDRKNSESFKNSPFGCDVCGKSFNLEKSMRNHMTYHDPSAGPAECVICHLRFRSKKERFKHRDLHRMTYTCTECGFVARDRGFAKQHYNVHAGKKFACPHCPSVFSHQPSYFNHLRTLHPGQMVACAECGETFASSLGVRQHRARAHRVSSAPKPEHKCPTCGASFFTTEALDRHVLSAPDAAHASLAPCAACGDNCADAAALAAHAAHCARGQLHCDECDKTFASASSFDTHHRRKHLKQRAPPRPPRAAPAPPGPRRPRRPPPPAKRVVCEVCGLLAQNETVLKYHLRIHQEIKPYPCTKCPKTFAAKHSLAWHLRTHTGERPFQCELCPLAFSLQSNWKRHHKVVHLGQRKSVPCELCDKTFTSRSGMKLHIATVHNNLPWPRRKRRGPRGGRGDDAPG